MAVTQGNHLCDAIELHTSEMAREKNQHTMEREERKRFLYNFFLSTVCVRSFCFHKRLIICECESAPSKWAEEEKTKWKEERTESKRNKRNFVKNGSIIFYLACAHTLSAINS